MTMTATIRRATRDDGLRLIRDMRHEDRLEIQMEGHFSGPDTAVSWSLDNSTSAFAILCGDELLCIFGTAPLFNNPSQDIMVVWALGTEAIRRHKRAFLRATPEAIRLLYDACPDTRLFINAMPATYPTYRKWAERYLAAQFSETSHVTPSGAVFTAFGIWRKGA